MDPKTLAFYFFGGIAFLGTFWMLIVRKVFHAALILIVILLAVAVVYFILIAEFVAVSQILIYAGGVLVLVLFGIMLTSKIAGKPLYTENRYLFPGSLAGVFLFGVLVKAFLDFKETLLPLKRQLTVQETGISFMTDYLLPFELVGILLLIALIGAALMAVPLKKENE